MKRKEMGSMRIGIDARFYGAIGKGLGRYTEKLILGLEDFDQTNEYFVFLRHENFDAYEPQAKNFHKVLADFPWYGWREQILFPRLLSSFQLHLMHFPHFNVPLLYRRPFIVTLHDLILFHFPTIKASELPPFLYWIKYWMYRGVIASALARARALITVSEFTRRDIEKHYPNTRGKILVTHEAADDFCTVLPEPVWREYLASLGLLEDSSTKAVFPFALYVGNSYPHKNLELILEAASRFPNLFFVLVGKEDYFYRNLRQKAERAHQTNVLFAGFVPDELLDSLYQRARVYLFPSLYEGFGLPALEALTRGLPVLASDSSSLPEVLEEAALFFNPEKPATFFAGLETLLRDEEKRASLRERGYRRAAQFSWKKMARETLNLYESILKKTV